MRWGPHLVLHVSFWKALFMLVASWKGFQEGNQEHVFVLVSHSWCWRKRFQASKIILGLKYCPEFEVILITALPSWFRGPNVKMEFFFCFSVASTLLCVRAQQEKKYLAHKIQYIYSIDFEKKRELSDPMCISRSEKLTTLAVVMWMGFLLPN